MIKHQSSPLHSKAVTQLHDVLRQRGIENLIVTGLVTNGCCDCTARDGDDRTSRRWPCGLSASSHCHLPLSRQPD